tara:strand:- start:491 stop:2812 length:2322 start_codon:yes stop_codon:yes gene_type:complete
MIKKEVSVNTNSDHKSTIAKLLATENIHVVHRKTQTASFNVATRELILPILKDTISNDLYDMFVCHEVAHALWTPLDMLDKVKDRGIDKSVVNVIEDARIEAMIQKKYPGSVTNFQKGYQELLQKDFFGIKNKDISELNVIDKINIFFKTGIDVKFTDEEKKLSDKVGQCKTPDDVLKLAVEIAGYHKQKQEEKKEEGNPVTISIGKQDDNGQDEGYESSQSESDVQDDTDSDEPAPADTEETTNDQDDQDQSKGDDKKEEDKKEQDTSSTNTEHLASGGKGEDQNLKTATDVSDLKSETDLASKIASLELNDELAKENVYVNLPSKLLMDKLIIDHKTIYNDLTSTFWNQKTDSYEDKYKEYMDKQIIQLYNDNKKVIQYMVKEFEMKKSADQYKRATVSKTGTLDMSKIHTYKFSDDLFAKMTTIPGATNHGMIMLLDWSGSMAYNMADTLKQLFNLIWFCQRTKIPYQVLAFSDVFDGGWRYSETKDTIVQKFVHNEYNISSLKLLEFFTYEQTKKQTMDMMKYLLCYSDYWNHRHIHRMYDMSPLCINHKYNLGGTPLDHALMTIPQIESIFSEKYKVQKTSLVLLTDGDSHSCSDRFELQSDGTWNAKGDAYVRDGSLSITDKKSNKTIKIKEGYRNDQTVALLQLIKKIKPNLSITGFFIAGSGRAGRVNLRTIEHKFKLNSYRHEDKQQIIKIQKELRTNRVAICKTQGYDEYYILPTAPKNSTESEELNIKEGAKTSSIKSAFTKSLKAKTVNRQLLNKFIGLVA